MTNHNQRKVDMSDNTAPVPFTELIMVPFDGGPLPAVLIDGEPHVVLRPVVDALGISWQAQHAKVSADETACVRLVMTQMPGDDQARRVVVVDLDTFSLWLAGLQPGRVPLAARPAVVIYRKRAGRVLREHFFGGGSSVARFDVPRDMGEALELALKQWRELQVLGARAVHAESRMRAIEAGDGIALRKFHKKYFSAVKERAFFEHLYAKGYLIDQRGKGRFNKKTGKYRDGSQHRDPTAKGKPFLYLHTWQDEGGRRHENTRVCPGDPELKFRDQLAAEGLVANENSTGYLFAIEGGARETA